ncbi:MAG TPA: DinB family protein [Dehalococcoidia bacterium]|nr:DinB family protein [Dehalococcoidia bacterium]
MTTAEELRATLSAGRERLLRAIAGVSEEQFKKRPEASDDGPAWSIAEVLAHLLQQEKLRSGRVALRLANDGAPITPSPPEAHLEGARAGRTAPVPQLIHGLLAARRETERLLDQAASTNALANAVVHPESGRQTIAWLIEEKVAAHEAEHAAQIEKLRELVGAPPLGSAGNLAIGQSGKE